MKKQITILLLSIFSSTVAQTEIFNKYKMAESLMQKSEFKSAYTIFKDIEPKCETTDTLYRYIIWYYANATAQIENEFRNNQQFDSSLHYEFEALKLIEKGKPFYKDNFEGRFYFMTKNIIVSYFGLGQLENAKKYKDQLYQAYKDKKLPKGLDEYFNFSFYKWEDKNVWGYEWFEELPEDRFSKSFSKVVYYVYSTNPDGTDKDQLYRLHVLMFHNMEPSNKIDYVLTKRLETASNEVSGTLYRYTYTKDIDYNKLQADIKEVLKGNYEPKTKTTKKKKR